jgi:hypothetical protein
MENFNTKMQNYKIFLKIYLLLIKFSLEIMKVTYQHIFSLKKENKLIKIIVLFRIDLNKAYKNHKKNQ